MIMFIQGVKLLLPMISYDERKLNGNSRKGVKLSIEELDMRGVPSLVGR